MSKKWKDKTKDSLKVTYLEGPDIYEQYAGVVKGYSGQLVPCTWDRDGKLVRFSTNGDYDLVPAEPEVEYRYGLVFKTEQSLGVDGGFGKETVYADNLKLGFIDGKLVSAEVLV